MPRKRTSPPRPVSAVTPSKHPSAVDAIRASEQRQPAPSVLIIDNEEAIVATWAEILRREGLQLGMATSTKEAKSKFRERDWDIILTDLRLGDDGDGVTILNEISQEAPATISIVLTGFPTLESAISAIRAGVHDYLIKPCKVEDMLRSIRRGLAKREAIQTEAVAKRNTMAEFKRLARENLKLKADLRRPHR